MSRSIYSELFEIAVAHVLELEGGTVNHKHDLGGHTNFGHSDAADGKRDGKIDLDGDGMGDVSPDELTLEQAVDKYWRDYWIPCNCDNLPPALALFVFDSAVNHGPAQAARFLQVHVGVVVDLDIGPITCARAKQFAHSESIALLFARRAHLYHGIVLANSTQAQFLNGWFKRLFKLQHFIVSNYFME